VTTTTVLEDDGVSVDGHSVVEEVKSSRSSVETFIDSTPGDDISVKVEEDPRKSVRKEENINRMGNQGPEKVKRPPIHRINMGVKEAELSLGA
jgi:hypothetical protein